MQKKSFVTSMSVIKLRKKNRKKANTSAKNRDIDMILF